ncbi:MAG: NADH-quinone oxidoreductase subunit N [Treponema sp.]|nr:NADH-quinone oxidoreductase subunit N [Treponema sp.]
MDFSAIRLELVAALIALGLLVFGLLTPRGKREVIGYIAAAAFLGLLALSFLAPGGGGSFQGGLYLDDPLSLFFKRLFITAAFLVSLMSLRFAKSLEESRSEFFSLLGFSLVGMMMLASANDFVSLYIGLELMSLPLVILTAYDRTSGKSTEAGTKYILLSAISSAVLLFGLSLLFGATGSFSYSDTLKALGSVADDPLVVIGSIMVVAGFAFKISAVPFHMWSPDIYEGAPAPVAAFLAVGSKAAGFAALIRLLLFALPASSGDFPLLILSLSVLSMVVGNLIALPQTNMKRLLAYSSIAHAGYILLGLVAASTAGVAAMLYYLVLYLFANVGIFAALSAFGEAGGSSEISSLKGMWKRSPFMAASLLVCLLSLAGIPPAAGFIGKFYLLAEVARQGKLWLAALALVMSVVSISYYISVIRVIVMEKAEDESRIRVSLANKAILAVSVLVTLGMGVFPAPITEWTRAIAGSIVR